MRKIILLATAALATTASPAMAEGYVGLDGSNVQLDSGFDADVWQADGAFGWTHGAWGGQLDGAVGEADYGPGFNDVSVWSLAGHLYWNAEGWRLGGVAAVAAIDAGFGESKETSFGVEGTYNLGANVVAGASALWGGTSPGSSTDTHNYELGVDYYPGPNIRIGGALTLGAADDADTRVYGIDAEFQPWSAPLSITVGLENYTVDGGTFVTDQDNDVISIGARWSFGAGSLRERDDAIPFDAQTAFVQPFFGTN